MEFDVCLSMRYTYKVSRLPTGEKKTIENNPSVAMMTSFGFDPMFNMFFKSLYKLETVPLTRYHISQSPIFQMSVVMYVVHPSIV